MQKPLFILFFSIALVRVGHGQAMVSKMLGKNFNGSTWGYGGFTNIEFPAESDNQAFRFTAMDAAYYPQRNRSIPVVAGYLSTKVGFKYVFSKDYVGFYIVPAIGYSYISRADPNNVLRSENGSAFAWSFEAGYAIAVGRRRNTINLGLQYEDDIGDADHRVSSIGFRVAFAFRPWWTWGH